MIRSLIFVFSALSAVPAVAGNTYFEQLLGIFNQSRPAIADEMNGWYSGRCYRWEDPNQAFGTILVARYVDVHGDPSNGPLFPPDEQKYHQYNVYGLGRQGTEAPADYWDNLNQSKIDFVNDLIRQGSLQNSYPTRGSLDIQFPYGNLFMSTRLYPTTQGVDPTVMPGYLVTRMALLRDTPPYPAGSIFAICYYFKKVK